MTTDKTVWGVHTQNDYLFLHNDVIAIGWKEMGDMSSLEHTRDAIKEKYAQVNPDASKQSIATNCGILYRFINEAKVGDYIVFPSKSDRQINIGVIEGEYFYSETTEDYPNQRKVKWLKHLKRTMFSQGALYEAGSFLTFFSIKNYADEFLSALDNDFKAQLSSSDSEDETVGATAEDIKESTKDFIIKELSRKLKGYDLENFIADLLNAMGYRTKVSPHGGDSGIDITAYKDELPPRILVQVKSGDGDIRESTIQSLKGAMREGDYGLFVTLADYTKNGKKYLESVPIIKGINGAELSDLVLKYYDKLSDKYQNMIPLEMVYIPVVKEE